MTNPTPTPSRRLRLITLVFLFPIGCGLYWTLLNMTDSAFSRDLIGVAVCGNDEKLIKEEGSEYEQYNNETGTMRRVQDINIYCQKPGHERRDVTGRIVLLGFVNTVAGLVFSVVAFLMLWSIRSRWQREQAFVPTTN